MKTGQFTYHEIAAKMGLNKNQVATKASHLGLINQIYLKRITKHKHLRKKALTYFLNHTFDETRVHLDLTQAEMKSLFTASYQDPKLAHLRKDTRRKDPWSLDEMLFLIRHAGIRERAWIGEKLNRSGQRNIKERMQKWNAGTKHLNGMPLSWARELWPLDDLARRIRTQAGPSGGQGIWRFQLIPWHDCLKLSKEYPTKPAIKSGIRAMVKFQEFIHQTNSAGWIRRKINQSLENK